MKKYKVRVVADMTFIIESEDKFSVNGDACAYVDSNKEDFDWQFDEINEVLGDDGE